MQRGLRVVFAPKGLMVTWGRQTLHHMLEVCTGHGVSGRGGKQPNHQIKEIGLSCWTGCPGSRTSRCLIDVTLWWWQLFRILIFYKWRSWFGNWNLQNSPLFPLPFPMMLLIQCRAAWTTADWTLTISRSKQSVSLIVIVRPLWRSGSDGSGEANVGS